jgi:hypothetical protein
VSYRPALTGRALAQFSDIKDDKVIYDAPIDKLLWPIDAPWDAWPVYPDGDEPRHWLRDNQTAGSLRALGRERLNTARRRTLCPPAATGLPA